MQTRIIAFLSRHGEFPAMKIANCFDGIFGQFCPSISPQSHAHFHIKHLEGMLFKGCTYRTLMKKVRHHFFMHCLTKERDKKVVKGCKAEAYLNVV